MRHLRFLKLVAAAAFSFSCSSALAAPFDIVDEYHGSDSHAWGDVIGLPALFDIQGANISRTGNPLTVDVFTNFFTDNGSGVGQGSYPGATFSGNGIGAGDLFLSNHWTPNGIGPEYAADNAATGTDWQYGFSLDDRWATGGSGAWYSLDGTGLNTEVLLSDDFLNCCTYRNGQEVAVDTSSVDVTELLGAGNTWTVDTGAKKATFTFDVTNTSLQFSPTVALHWNMTCGNDTIEGAIHGINVPQAVPEPAPFGFAALGLLLVAGARARRDRAMNLVPGKGAG